MMNRVVWKFILNWPGAHHPMMPAGADLLSVGFQGDDLVLWALVDPDAIAYPRPLAVLATGLPFPVEGRPLKHVGTAVHGATGGGAFPNGTVWHVFEVL